MSRWLALATALLAAALVGRLSATWPVSPDHPLAQVLLADAVPAQADCDPAVAQLPAEAAQGGAPPMAPLPKERIVEIARQALVGKLNIQDGAPVEVTEQSARYVVTFGYQNPPGPLGPDFAARVTVDAQSGEVLEVLGGS